MATYVPAGTRAFTGTQQGSLNSALSVLYAQESYSLREKGLRRKVGEQALIYENVAGRTAAWAKAAQRAGAAYKSQAGTVREAVSTYEKAAQERAEFTKGLRIARRRGVADVWREQYGTRFRAAKITEKAAKSDWQAAQQALQSIHARFTGIQHAIERSEKQAKRAYNVYQAALDAHSRWRSYSLTGFPSWVGQPSAPIYTGTPTTWQGRT